MLKQQLKKNLKNVDDLKKYNKKLNLINIIIIIKN